MALVRYIGGRDTHVDRLFGTTAAWDGPGDVQEIDDAKALKMCALCPQTYEEAIPGRSPGAREAAAAGAADAALLDSAARIPDGDAEVPLPAASRKALADYAESLGMSVPDDLPRAALAAEIEGLLAERDAVQRAAELRESDSDPSPRPLAEALADALTEADYADKPTLKMCLALDGVRDVYAARTVTGEARDIAWAEARRRLGKPLRGGGAEAF